MATAAPAAVADGDKRLAALQLHLLKKQVARAQAEHDQLKAVVHEERDLQLASRKQSKLQAKLRQLAEAEARLDGQLCYGLPPEWRTAGNPGAGAGAGGSSGSTTTSTTSTTTASRGEWGSGWLTGTEVVYTAQAVGEQGRQAEGSGQPAQLDMRYSEQAVKLQLYRRPFAVGGLRQAFYAR